MDEQTEEAFDRATEALCEAIEEVRTLTGTNFPLDVAWSIPDAFLAAACLGDAPPIRRYEYSPSEYYFEVDDWIGNFIAGGLSDSDVHFEVFRTICMNNIAARKPIPDPFIPTLGLLIAGQQVRPKRRPGARHSQDIVPWLLISGACYARDAFGLELTRSDASESHSACDAVCMVVQKYGLSLKYSRLRDWCTKSDYADLRNSADLFVSIYETRYLHELGVLKQWQPFAPIMELTRMPK